MQCCTQIPWLTSTMKVCILFPVMKLLKSCYPAELLQILKLLYPGPPLSFTHHFIAQLTAKHASGGTVQAIKLEIPCFRTELSFLTQHNLTRGNNSWRQKEVTKHPGDMEASTGCGADKDRPFHRDQPAQPPPVTCCWSTPAGTFRQPKQCRNCSTLNNKDGRYQYYSQGSNKQNSPPGPLS